MTTANHIIKVASNVYYSVNGKVRVQKLSGSWIVSKVHNDGRYFEAVGGFVTVREALAFAEGVEA
jgi:hypothetical protein